MNELLTLFGRKKYNNPNLAINYQGDDYLLFQESLKTNTYVLANPTFFVKSEAQLNHILNFSFSDSFGKSFSKSFVPSKWAKNNNYNSKILRLEGLQIFVNNNVRLDFELIDDEITLIWELHEVVNSRALEKKENIFFTQGNNFVKKQNLIKNIVFTISKKKVSVISLAFSGNFAGNSQTLTLSEKINFRFTNIFNLANAYTVKYSNTHLNPDWTLIAPQSLANIQTAINGGSTNYLLKFEIQSYSSLSKAVFTLDYLTMNEVSSVQVVQLNALAQDTWIGLPPNITVQLASIVSANTPASIFHFGFKTSANDDFTLYDLDFAGLNALLLSTADSIERMITFYSEYQAPNISDTPILIFN